MCCYRGGGTPRIPAGGRQCTTFGQPSAVGGRARPQQLAQWRHTGCLAPTRRHADFAGLDGHMGQSSAHAHHG
eukprot:8572348-Lingulodinium_polyedra.AAC.1